MRSASACAACPVGFMFNFTVAGTGTVDGTPTAGTFDDLTDLSGCTTGTVTTSGVGGSDYR